MDEYHRPVLLTQAIDGLGIVPGQWYVDGTLGGGGHTWEILSRGGNVIGIDTDIDAIGYVSKRWEHDKEIFKGQELQLIASNFSGVGQVGVQTGKKISGLLLDLGVSSYQLDTPERGFSYRFGEAPLDLRMNRNIGEPASVLVRRGGREDLYEIIATFGEEERARTIADAIVRARQIKPIETTGDLLAVIEGVFGKNQSTHAASRVFQAFRMAVNDEIGVLKKALVGSMDVLSPGGRVAVISFHSLEDRIVKLHFQSDQWKVITKKPITPGPSELATNRRARSAKLRIAERL